MVNGPATATAPRPHYFYTEPEELAEPSSDTDDLRSEQERKKAEEIRRAREAESEEDTRTHARRAERSEYLKEKLEERAESEQEE